ncbi:hypothetical protein FRB90_005841 [Tulasnella sp. 427]|nr:hypothetical protein FRB90_005841 [Tulasnella sp. 427]
MSSTDSIILLFGAPDLSCRSLWCLGKEVNTLLLLVNPVILTSCVNIRLPSSIELATNGIFIKEGKFESLPKNIAPERPSLIELSSENIPGGGIDAGNAWVFKPPNGYALMNGHPITTSAGVVEPSNPQDEAKAATEQGNTITSTETFKDEYGHSFQLTAQATRNELPGFIIKVVAVCYT